MALFRHYNREKSQKSRHIYAVFELVYTAVDFTAAMFFLVGSIMFFWESLMFSATWFFVLGSILFGVKPSLRLAREIKLARLGDDEDLADRYGN
ncbi:YrhK family protein [Pelagovum pacificum]|uniref:YrhK domain-containing protein n=1 Tax=Pelagovum pacificum TaxID=2588711 RepID=A0A5C5GC98_9RHOB|nr:YrhK family protein [Pelagovum pacificum]QQA42520.1 YrhK family protein [Pelagovum pacificum]TNY31604.1 hypothetical protein FHY64_16500 [Pelagovum pacificum]